MEEVRSEMRVIEVSLARGDPSLAIVVAAPADAPMNRGVSQVTFAILAVQAPRAGDTITAAVEWTSAESAAVEWGSAE